MKEVVQQPIESDEELLSQPGSEYMSPAQLDFFRRKLQALEAELRVNAG